MDSSTADHRIVVELLLNEKDRLMGQLTEAQQQMMADFSEENSARFGQIYTRLEEVRGLLQVHGASRDEKNLRSAPPAPLPTPETSVVVSHEDGNTHLRHAHVPDGEAARPVVDLTSPSAPRLDRSHSVQEETQIHADPSTNVDGSITTKSSKALQAANDMPCVCPGTKYSHLITVDGKSIELVCYVCGANCNHRTREYFDGAYGYYRHVIRHASEAHLNRSKIFERAGLRGGLLPSSDSDISRINNREDPIDVRSRCTGNKQTRVDTQPKKKDKASAPLNQHLVPYVPAQFDQLDKVRYPTVVFINGAWFAISCHVCGASVCPDKGNKTYGKFWNGLASLASHMVLKHNVDIPAAEIDAKDWNKVANLCYGIELSEEDVMRIRGGKDPKTAIVKQVSFNQTLKEAKEVARQASTSALNSTQNSSSTRLSNGATNRPSSSAATSERSSFFAPSVASTPTTTASSQVKPRSYFVIRHDSSSSQPNKRSISGSSSYDRRSSLTGIASLSQTRWEELQSIVAGAERGVDYTTTRKKPAKRKRGEIDYDYDDGPEDSGSEDEEPLARRVTRGYGG